MTTHHIGRTTHHIGVPERLAELLETLPAGERQQITAWLLERSAGGIAAPFFGLRHLASTLPAGEDSQLVTLRLPADRHAQLRDWCAEHGFTMAAVVRGLVERFLEEQSRLAARG
jgi:hypothetical protein